MDDCLRHRLGSVLASLLLLSAAAGASAQTPAPTVVLDGTLRAENAGVVLPGPDVTIPGELGLQEGANLFHSFLRFGVETGGSATFTAGTLADPGLIERIIARVTGGELSTIDGLLASDLPGASLYLINPAGIVFGENASLDVTGSFAASTAHFVDFDDGTRFLAVAPAADALVTSALPSSFGFLPPESLPAGFDATPAAIEATRSNLAVGPGERLSLIGGDLTLTASTRSGTGPIPADEGLLRAASGVVDLVSVASDGEVMLRSELDADGRLQPSTTLTGFTALGDISLDGDTPGAGRGVVVNASGSPNGSIVVRADDLQLDRGAVLRASNDGDLDSTARGVDVDLRGDLAVAGGSSIRAQALGAGTGGAMRYRADELRIENGSIDGDAVGGSGDAGGIEIVAREVRLLGPSSSIRTNSSFGGRGEAGDIDITAERLEIDAAGGNSGLFAQFGSNAAVGDSPYELVPDDAQLFTADAGDIDIQADEVSITNGGLITADVIWGNADSGDITIRGDEIVLSGRATVQDRGSFISSSQFLIREPVKVFATPAGQAGTITLAGDSIRIAEGAVVEARNTSVGGGDAGRVVLQGGDIEVDRALVDVSHIGFGAAGSIDVSGDSLAVTGRSPDLLQSGLSSLAGVIASERSAIGIDVDRLVVSDGAVIQAGTTGPAQGGTIEITADEVDVVRGGSIESTAFRFGDNPFSFPGLAGDVSIQADRIDLSDGGRVATSGTGGGEGGNLRLEADVVRSFGGELIAGATSDSDAGSLTVSARELVRLDGTEVSASVAGGLGGNVTLESEGAIYLGRGTRVTASAVDGDGGRIELRAPGLIVDASVVIDASSETGTSGTVEVSSVEQNLNAALESLPVSFETTSASLRPRCGSAVDAEGRLAIAPPPLPPTGPAGLLLAGGLELLPGRSGIASGHSDPSREDVRKPITQLAMRPPIGPTRGDADGSPARGETPASPASALWHARGEDLDPDERAAARAALRDAAATAERAGDRARAASLLLQVARLGLLLDEPEESRAALEASLEQARGSDDPLALPLIASGVVRGHAALGRGRSAAETFGIAAAALARADEDVDRAHLHVHLAEGARRIGALRDRERWTRTAYEQLIEAAGVARRADSPRARAYALASLGSLYGQEARREEALALVREAIAIAEVEGFGHEAHRWHAEEGRLLWSLGRAGAAIDAFERAVAEQRRARRAAAAGGFSVGDLEDDGALYRTLIDAYLESARREAAGPARDGLLRQARARVEELKRAELRSYFRDECVTERAARSLPIGALDPRSAVLYPLVLPDRLELLVEFADGIEWHTIEISEEALSRRVSQLRRHLEGPYTRRYLPHAQALYDLLIRPIDPSLEARDARTLVLVPDDVLRTIPFASLHDGERFVIERMGMAVVPGLDLVDPGPTDPADEDVLLAGISESVQGYPEISGVREEIEYIHSLHGGRIWLDEAFRTGTLGNALSERPPGIVHLATHGRFTGDPTTSFILTYDGRVSMKQLESLVSNSKYSSDPIDLLVLSACETAAGDERAALGLAGLAVRAGARSALGSLWSIHDEATRDLIRVFYRELGRPGVSKAEALRRAQVALLRSERFRHPAFWSPFLLISNWL